MKRSVVVICLSLLVVSGAALAADDGQAIFLAQKCEMCHAVSSVGRSSVSGRSKLTPSLDPRVARR